MGKQPLDVSGPSLTQQSAKDECDINVIIERAKRGMDLSNLQRDNGVFMDLVGMPSYAECLMIVQSGNEAFMTLDAKVRKRFDNDPAKLLDFLSDDANREEAIKLGLVNAPVEPVKGDSGPETKVSKGKGSAKDEA